MHEVFEREPIPEETLRIDLPDGLHIRGVLCAPPNQPDAPVVIMMHGRPGSGNDSLQRGGAYDLYRRGFATLRLWMYDTEPGTRNLVDCTLDTHVADFEAVARHVRASGATKVYAIGHSYGGLTILKSTAELDGAVLWDPSHGGFWLKYPNGFPGYPERTIGNLVIGLNGAGYIMSLEAYKYDHALGDTSALAAGKSYPMAIIAASDGLAEFGKQYEAAAGASVKYNVIKANHTFDNSHLATLQLFERTGSALEEFTRGNR